MTVSAPDITYRCRDECGASVTMPAGAGWPPAWEFLPISQKWRCPACRGILEERRVMRTTTPTNIPLGPEDQAQVQEKKA